MALCSSVKMFLSFAETRKIAKQIAASQTSFTPYIVAGVFYFIANYVVAFAMERIEKAFSYYR